MANSEISAAKLRAWWAHRQWLDGTHQGAAAAETLAATGWARSVGGAAPYLGLFARAGLDREAVDGAVARVEVHELPSARGCTYVLPATDFALGLAIGAGAPAGELAAAEKHLGVTPDEMERLCSMVGQVLSYDIPLAPAAIKEATGDAVRSLGEAGKKRGQSTTLPLALGLLQARGLIRRVPVNGRLDQQRYGYVAWDQPVKGSAVELAERYFAWAAPASVKHFRWFSGYTAATAKQAIAPLDLIPSPARSFFFRPNSPMNSRTSLSRASRPTASWPVSTASTCSTVSCHDCSPRRMPTARSRPPKRAAASARRPIR